MLGEVSTPLLVYIDARFYFLVCLADAFVMSFIESNYPLINHIRVTLG